MNEKKKSFEKIVNKINLLNQDIDYIKQIIKDKTKSLEDIDKLILNAAEKSEQLIDNLKNQTTTETYQKLESVPKDTLIA